MSANGESPVTLSINQLRVIICIFIAIKETNEPIHIHLKSLYESESRIDDKLKEVSIQKEGVIKNVETDYFIPLFGLTPKLGPLSDWGLEIENNSIISLTTLTHALLTISFNTSRNI